MKLGHSKAAIFEGEFRRPGTSPGKMHAQKSLVKMLSFHPELIPRFRAGLNEC